MSLHISVAVSSARFTTVLSSEKKHRSNLNNTMLNKQMPLHTVKEIKHLIHVCFIYLFKEHL